MNEFKIGDIVEVYHDTNYNGTIQKGSWGTVIQKESFESGEWDDREEFDNHLHIQFNEIYERGEKQDKEYRMNWYARKDRLRLRKVDNWKARIDG